MVFGVNEIDPCLQIVKLKAITVSTIIVGGHRLVEKKIAKLGELDITIVRLHSIKSDFTPLHDQKATCPPTHPPPTPVRSTPHRR